MTQTQMTLAVTVVVGIVLVKWCFRSPARKGAPPMRARSGGSSSPLLWLIVLAVVLYFLWPHLGTLLPAMIKQLRLSPTPLAVPCIRLPLTPPTGAFRIFLCDPCSSGCRRRRH